MHAEADKLALRGEFGHALLVQDLEASFGLRLPLAETQAWYFVGDIYRSLIARLGPAMEGGARADILTYYYLRRGIRALRGETVTPDTPLNGLAAFQPRRFLKLLEAETSLRLPEAEGSWIGWGAIVACLVAAAGFATGIPPFSVNWPFALLALAMAAFLPLFDPGRFPAGCRTVGQLADKAAGLNYAKLRGDGAAGDAAAVWQALLGVLAAHGARPGQEITTRTILVTEQPA